MGAKRLEARQNVPARASAKTKGRSCLILLLAVSLLCGVSMADQVWWQPSTGNWSNPANWQNLNTSEYVLPSGADYAYVCNGGTAQIANYAAVAGTLYVDTSAVELSSGSLTVSNYETLGDTHAGAFTQTGGTHSIGLGLAIGGQAFGVGTYNLSGNAVLTTDGESIGSIGTGTFNQTGGTNTVTHNVSIGVGTDSIGTYLLSGAGAALTAHILDVGHGGTGTFTQSGGTASVNSLYVAGAGATGTFTLSEGSFSSSGEWVGIKGHGTITQTGGSNTITGWLNVGADSNSHGVYELRGGSLVAAGIVVDTGGSLTNASSIRLTGATGLTPVGGSFEQTAGGTLTVEVAGTAAGQWGQMITGQARLAGTLAVTLMNGFKPDPGRTFWVITTADGFGGTSFDNVANGGIITSTDGGASFIVNYGPGSDNPNQVLLTATPEPATLSLLALGAGAMIRRRRK